MAPTGLLKPLIKQQNKKALQPTGKPLAEGQGSHQFLKLTIRRLVEQIQAEEFTRYLH